MKGNLARTAIEAGPMASEKKEEKIMKHKIMFSSLLLALSLASAPTARAITTWYVDGANGSDSNNCLSPTTACKTIGHAISRAASGDSTSNVATAPRPSGVS